MASQARETPRSASANEQDVLAKLDAALELHQNARLDLDGTSALELPETLLTLLHQVVHHLAQGDAVTVVATAQELTTQEAAALLGISRTYLIRVLDAGELPYTRLGSHRRLRLADVLAYRQRSRARQQAGIADLIATSESLGLYRKGR